MYPRHFDGCVRFRLAVTVKTRYGLFIQGTDAGQKLIAEVAVNAHLFDTGNKKLLFAGNDDNRLVRWNVANGTVRKLPRSFFSTICPRAA